MLWSHLGLNMTRGSKQGSGSPTDRRAAMPEAVVMLRPIAGQAAPDPESTRRMAQAVLTDAEAQTGLRPEATNVMDQLHSFSIRAPQSFIDALSKSKQVAQVLANESSESAFIEPVRKRSVRLPE